MKENNGMESKVKRNAVNCVSEVVDQFCSNQNFDFSEDRDLSLIYIFKDDNIIMNFEYSITDQYIYLNSSFNLFKDIDVFIQIDLNQILPWLEKKNNSSFIPVSEFGKLKLEDFEMFEIDSSNLAESFLIYLDNSLKIMERFSDFYESQHEQYWVCRSN